MPNSDATKTEHWLVSLQAEFEIGELDGDPHYEFGRIDGIAQGCDESMFVLDGLGPSVRMFSPDGQYVRHVGRVGSGPGEFRQILGIRTTVACEIALLDAGNSRIVVFDGAGDFQRSHRVSNALFSANAFHVDTAGNYYVMSRRAVTGSAAPAGTSLSRINAIGELEGSVELPFEDPSGAAPAALRGIGVRLEDDVLITAGGTEVLTAALPLDPDQ